MTIAAPASAPARRRIAMVCDWCLPRFGGLELQLLDLSRALVAAGHTVEIITSTPGPDTLLGIPVHRLAGRRAPRYGFAISPRQFRELRALIDGQSFDVVHVQCGVIAPLAYAATRLAARTGHATAATFHSVYAYLQPVLRVLSGVSGAGRWPVAWSAVSNRVAREARRALEGRGQPVVVDVLPNGIDPMAWRGATQTPRSAEEFRIVSVLRLQVRKRPRSLFRVLDEAQALTPTRRITLDVIGDGPERRAIERLAAARNGTVRVHGRLDREQIRAVFARSDAFLLPTRMESFGIAALEAQCAGLPIVALRNTGVEDFVTHGRNGLLATSDHGLATATAQLAADESLRREIVDRNTDTVPPFAWPDIVTATLAQYDRAVRLRNAR